MKKYTIITRDLSGTPTEIVGRIRGIDTNNFRVIKANVSASGDVINYGYICKYASGSMTVAQNVPKYTGTFTDCGYMSATPIKLGDIL